MAESAPQVEDVNTSIGGATADRNNPIGQDKRKRRRSKKKSPLKALVGDDVLDVDVKPDTDSANFSFYSNSIIDGVVNKDGAALESSKSKPGSGNSDGHQALDKGADCREKPSGSWTGGKKNRNSRSTVPKEQNQPRQQSKGANQKNDKNIDTDQNRPPRSAKKNKNQHTDSCEMANSDRSHQRPGNMTPERSRGQQRSKGQGGGQHGGGQGGNWAGWSGSGQRRRGRGSQGRTHHSSLGEEHAPEWTNGRMGRRMFNNHCHSDGSPGCSPSRFEQGNFQHSQMPHSPARSRGSPYRHEQEFPRNRQGSGRFDNRGQHRNERSRQDSEGRAPSGGYQSSGRRRQNSDGRSPYREKPSGPGQEGQDSSNPKRVRSRGGGGGGRGQNQGQSGRQGKKQAFKFSPHWSVEKVSEGLKRGELIEGPIRINPRNFEDAYVPHPDGKSDVYIHGIKNRNRALNGDIVAVLLKPREEWKVLMEDVQAFEENMVAEMEALTLEADVNNHDNDDNYIDDDNDDDDADVVVEEEYTEEENEGEDKIQNGAVGNNDTSAAIYNESEIPECENLNDTRQDDTTPVTKVLEDTQESCSTTSSDVNLGAATCVPTSEPSQDAVLTPSKDASSADPQKTATSSVKKKEKSQKKGSPRYKHTTLKQFTDGKSPAAKVLFHEGNSEEEAQSNHDKFLQRMGTVVYIIEKKHSRASTGHIKLMQDRNKDKALFSPIDPRVPRICIAMTDCPQGFYERPEDFSRSLFVARITEWDEVSQFPKGSLLRSLGEAGEIEPETEGMLIQYGVDYSEFSDQALSCLPQTLPWSIPEYELEARRAMDFREECVFTIDPATARDLDDALHCKPLGDGLYEVGVHIADVSYFVLEGTELDVVASQRATSVYLVQKVIPMLPRLLCEQLCSLNPDEDRLTFSVVWKITEEGEILDEKFGRSIIRSCVKLSYEHAQGFIEEPDRKWTLEEFPPISEGFTIDQIKQKVLDLQKMAVNLRRRRFDNGALRLDQVKLQYVLDKETGLPCGYSVYQQKDSNRLIEEFMLLANMAVAHKIYGSYPEKSLLRRHPPPQTKMVNDLVELCSNMGIPINASSSGALQESLAAYCDDDIWSKAKTQILTVLCSKPMQTARYFCTGCIDDEDAFRHYALSVPLYTHFTSPIRRYADVIVHRLLGACLGYCDPPRKSKESIQRQAEHCNDRKNASKQVQELSSDMFFAIFVKECGPLEEQGMVMGVLDKGFDVLVLKLGVVKRVYCDKLPLSSFSYQKVRKCPELTLVWAPDDDHPREDTQKVTIFTHVQCILKADDQPLKWSATVHRPVETI